MLVDAFGTKKSQKKLIQQNANVVEENKIDQKERFEDMSGNIVSRIDEMGKRIDDVENSINDLMNDLGVEELDLH